MIPLFAAKPEKLGPPVDGLFEGVVPRLKGSKDLGLAGPVPEAVLLLTCILPKKGLPVVSYTRFTKNSNNVSTWLNVWCLFRWIILRFFSGRIGVIFFCSKN